MQQAVRMAGILDKRPGVSRTVLTFISEPEAAALATIKRIDENCEIEVSDKIPRGNSVCTDNLKLVK